MNNGYATSWHEAKPPPSRFNKKSRYLLRGLLLSVYSVLNRKQEDNYLRCLYCHYVFDDQREDFEKLILEFKKIGQFVDTPTCVDMIQGKRKIDKRYFHLSFDDGFRNHFTNAVPILEKHKVPAIFFVPSSLVGADYETAMEYCTVTTRYKAVIEMMKWDDLREMLSMGFEIGSHTKTHARFSTLSDNKSLLKDEIFGSKKELEDNLSYHCKYISWPYGSLADVDNNSLENVKMAGYDACFGAYRGTVFPRRTDIYRIPRHQFEVQWPVSHILYFARGNMERKESKR